MCTAHHTADLHKAASRLPPRVLYSHSTTINMNNFQDQGRAAYKRGDYKKAIELFDRAIGRAPSVQLLDNRAACYEKLNELSTALKDAKKAIQLHREDATGYLRAGRVLVKMEKQSVALEIYTHGLKCVKHVGHGYEVSPSVHSLC